MLYINDKSILNNKICNRKSNVCRFSLSQWAVNKPVKNMETQQKSISKAYRLIKFLLFILVNLQFLPDLNFFSERTSICIENCVLALENS